MHNRLLAPYYANDTEKLLYYCETLLKISVRTLIEVIEKVLLDFENIHSANLSTMTFSSLSDW